MRTIMLLICVFFASIVHAQLPVGETHREVPHPPAAVRDSAHRPMLRVTIWYPAAPGSIEKPILIGPEGKPLFDIGMAAPDAPPAPNPRSGKRPVILLSHGFGGTARIMGWFGVAMARAGYVVIAVDHPGNNGLDPMTVPGAVLGWERPGDLRRALEFALADSQIGSHIDSTRIGIAGFSLGGFTALVGAGARADLPRLRRFCAAHPLDGVCRPQIEFPISPAQRAAFENDPANTELIGNAGADHSIPHVRAVFAMAPAVVQGLTPESLRHVAVPVSIILGGSDDVAPPQTNGVLAARLIPHAQLKIIAGAGHYNFLANCAPGADLPICAGGASQEDVHAAAIGAALRLFRQHLAVVERRSGGGLPALRSRRAPAAIDPHHQPIKVSTI